ncbi:retention module-containing protein, partial [Halomonas sp. ML-15]|uniref:retention module-containing protein n=1 Tax=Halomonas sp. ML-15 TaxID=2773305 RepID=UPI001745EB37
MAIATVLSITGQAWARDADGNLRELSVGDTLVEGETLVTSDNGSVQLDFLDGLDPTTISGGQEIAMTPEVDADAPVDAADSEVSDADLEALLAAIDDDDIDLLDVLDATAAGAGGAGAADGGHGFVRLARITEGVDPLAFEFGTVQGGEFITAQGESAPVDAAEVEETIVEGPEPELGLPSITLTGGDDLLEGLAEEGNTVATVTASSDPLGQGLTYGLTDGSDPNGYYAIDPATGTVTLTGAGAEHVN